MRPNAGEGVGLRGLSSINEYSCAHGAQINFGDLTLLYGINQQILKYQNRNERNRREDYYALATFTLHILANFKENDFFERRLSEIYPSCNDDICILPHLALSLYSTDRVDCQQSSSSRW
jgi:hypothetical protein